MLIIRTILVLLVAAALTACASKEKLAQRDREDARRDMEYARERGQRQAEEFNGFLVGYAQGLGKKPSQLTSAERAEAYRIFRRD